MKDKHLTEIEKEILDNLEMYVPTLDEERQKILLQGTRGLVILAAITPSKTA